MGRSACSCLLAVGSVLFIVGTTIPAAPRECFSAEYDSVGPGAELMILGALIGLGTVVSLVYAACIGRGALRVASAAAAVAGCLLIFVALAYVALETGSCAFAASAGPASLLG